VTTVAAALGWLTVPILLAGAIVLVVWSQHRARAAALVADSSVALPAGAERRRMLRGRRKPVALGMAVVVLPAVQGTAPSRHWIAKTYTILSCNMAPTLSRGDRVVVENASNGVRRGDIVYYIPPPNERRLRTTCASLV
jgi:hypothetical protein